MATEAQVIDKLRRAIADFKQPHKFEKSFYLDAIEFSLGKLNHDFGLEYTVVSEVPIAKLFLLIKLGTIQMAYSRVSSVLDSDSDPDDEESGISSVQVPDLLVSGPESSDAREADTWIDLANKLQEEYDGELEQSGGQSQAATIQVANVHKVSLKTGGFISRKLDPGPSSVTLAAFQSGNTVTLSWEKLYASDFYSYDVYRDTVADMSEETRLVRIGDNDTVEYEDEGLVSGTYYYRVKTLNRNLLSANSNITEATV